MGKKRDYPLSLDGIESDVSVLCQIKNNRTKLAVVAADLCGLTLDELRGKRRPDDLVAKRWRVYYLLRCLGYSLKQVGDMTNKNHATVLNGLNRFEELAVREERKAA